MLQFHLCISPSNRSNQLIIILLSVVTKMPPVKWTTSPDVYRVTLWKLFTFWVLAQLSYFYTDVVISFLYFSIKPVEPVNNYFTISSYKNATSLMDHFVRPLSFISLKVVYILSSSPTVIFSYRCCNFIFMFHIITVQFNFFRNGLQV